jgi:hypothetical protein
MKLRTEERVLAPREKENFFTEFVRNEENVPEHFAKAPSQKASAFSSVALQFIWVKVKLSL